MEREMKLEGKKEKGGDSEREGGRGRKRRRRFKKKYSVSLFSPYGKEEGGGEFFLGPPLSPLFFLLFVS